MALANIIVVGNLCQITYLKFIMEFQSSQVKILLNTRTCLLGEWENVNCPQQNQNIQAKWGYGLILIKYAVSVHIFSCQMILTVFPNKDTDVVHEVQLINLLLKFLNLQIYVMESLATTPSEQTGAEHVIQERLTCRLRLTQYRNKLVQLNYIFG